MAVSQQAEGWWCPGWLQKGLCQPDMAVDKAGEQELRGEGREGRAGRQGLPMAVEGGWLLLHCFSCVLQMDAQTGMPTDHGSLLSSPSSATQPESCQHSTGQISPCHGLTGSLEAPHSHGQRQLHTLFPWVAEGWAPRELLAPALAM